jgi:hypothetical protein
LPGFTDRRILIEGPEGPIVSEDERSVRDRLKRHVRERLRQLKEQQKRGTGERDARDAETPTVAPTPRRKSPKTEGG